MSTRTTLIPPEVFEYVLRSTREPEVLAELRAATKFVAHNVMQIGADQGALMALLVRLIGARRCIELGTYTGYSALAVALALPADGKLITCDVSEEWTSVGVPFWRKAGVANKIELKLGPALETLDELLGAGAAYSFDFAFIDADKPNYPAYFERLLTLVRKGGLIAVDNTLALSGTPVMTQTSTNAKAMVAFNAQVLKDERVDVAMLTVGEGLTLLRVR
jgi:predicted O-methyltransferase YrrM